MASISQVSINLSAYSLRDPKLAEHVLGMLNSFQFPAHKLCIEITESEAIVNVSAAKSFMEALKVHGVRFALDDFGTGFASFGYLKQLPFDTVKIDGAFVRDMDTDMPMRRWSRRWSKWPKPCRCRWWPSSWNARSWPSNCAPWAWPTPRGSCTTDRKK